MIDYSQSYSIIRKLMPVWSDSFESQVQKVFEGNRWGDLPKWIDVIKKLPDITPSQIDLNSSAITIGQKGDCDDNVRGDIETLMRDLHPWRKGPFDLFGVYIDTEWRSDLKWDRLKGHIQPLKDKMVLDVGCGSGYHVYRMGGQEAKLVIGIDPTMLYVVQFYAFQRYIQAPHLCVFPIGIDDMPEDMKSFDTVFSMGLLYHRRSPLDHLLQLKSFLKDGGELVLETLVIDGDEGQVLTPQDRYAKMANVFFIPSVLTLESWLKKMGFKNIYLVDVTKTTSEEQRVTDWMGFESLADFLDPSDSQKTIEGYPAPQRAIILARK